jgi:hypothetical protein
MKLAHSYVSGGLGRGAKQAMDLAAAAAIGQGAYKIGKASAQSLKKYSGKSLRGTKSAAAVSYSNPMSTTGPLTTGTRDGTRVSNRELLTGAVVANESWAISQTYSLNPGLPGSFPWLSALAGKYEQYRFHKLRFIYVPSCSTSTTGDIILMADYNAQDPLPTTEVQAVNHPGTMVGSVWDQHAFSCSVRDMHSLGPRKFVRSTAMAGDIKTFDVGNFILSSANGTGTSVGKLFVEYDVEFFIPQLVPYQASIPSRTTLLSKTIQLFTSGTAANVSFIQAFDPLNFYENMTSVMGTCIPPAGVYLIQLTGYVTNSANETSSGTITFLQNGSMYLDDAVIYTTPGIAGGTYSPISLTSIIPFNGSDSFAVRATLGAATGALNIHNFQLTVTLA